ncbi:hypothetical protein [Mycoplasmopsis glycophila]|uniref:Uncharacterized protein n=1 Tax=Mycoplasmopsis glycophila TaxID=171285 RepID=A0A449AUL0_9BACT|nr:hypothetical protein [Mycoplasmopsis glycophila]VEU70163.1 Uncharacterised protein [Mycoplasmopsis glycophila]
MTAEVQELEQEKDIEQSSNKKRKIWIALLVVLIIVLLVLICVEIAYIADFYRFKDSGQDGLLWTVAQRQNGLFGELIK